MLTFMQFRRLPPTLVLFVLSFIHNAVPVQGQYVPPASYDNIVKSHLNPKITVSYKQPPAGTCMTAYTTQKQYTGYIDLPPYTLAPIQQNYSINTFFWFVEARQVPEAAPLTIWLNGGPGTSSMFGLFNEVGPCEVVQMSDGTYGTQSRLWGWDRSSNLLFIDQPNQVGFSYDTAMNASFDLLTQAVFEPPTPPSSSLPPFMYLNGTFGTDSEDKTSPGATTANTTEIAAQSIWHFLQTWLSTFPQYNPATRPNVTTVPSPAAGVHLFTESYGGKYGPVFANFFEQQNNRLSNGSLPSNSTLEIQLETVGIINGLIDDAVQDQYYPYFAYNNTYGLQTINQDSELNTLNLYNTKCLPAINACRISMNSSDPQGYGNSAFTNKMCQDAQLTCSEISIPYYGAGYNPYDIRQKLPSPDPVPAYAEYLNNGSVLAAIGARINYTESNRYVQEGFISTGDTIRGGQMEDLALLLSMGIRVALIYGDADYICNWYGGQAVSLAIASLVPNTTNTFSSSASATPVSYASAFPSAGYAEIVVNASYVGGSSRQYGNLSFSRVYDAGHMVPYYQAETAFTVFARIIGGTDISTGQIVNLSNFTSTGPINSTHTNSVPAAPQQTCWVRAVNSTCSKDDVSSILKGQGFVEHGIYYQDTASVQLPASTVVAGIPGVPSNASTSLKGSTSTIGLTGVYTATATPSPSGAAYRAAGDTAILGLAMLPMALLVLSIVFGAGVVL